jgi:Uma2 family endonuclease
MVASLLTGQEKTQAFAELLHPEPLADGTEPEERLILCGVSWKRYLALDEALGHDRPSPRFYFLKGDLEILTTSLEHERIKKWIGGMLDIYFEESRIEIMPHGQATIRRALKQAGAEPDESWCIGQEAEVPNLVLDIALTSGGLNKLDIYREFKVSEVWFWRANKLEIFALGSVGAYEVIERSRLLPDLDLRLIERCVVVRSWQQARQMFRAGLARSKD